MAASSVAISRRGRRLLAVYFAGFLAFLYVPLALMLGSRSARTSRGCRGPGSRSTGTGRPTRSTTCRRSRRSGGRCSTRSWIGLAVAIIDTTLALLFSYGMARGQRVVGRPALLALCLMPLAAPPAAYGAAVLVFARRGPVDVPFGLHLVLLAHAVLFLPIAILFLLPRISAIAREILESSEDLGATRTADAAPRRDAAGAAGAGGRVRGDLPVLVQRAGRRRAGWSIARSPTPCSCSASAADRPPGR